VDVWLAQREAELLPVPYFHVVFTLPPALRRTVRQHAHVLYPVLMRSAAQALQKLAMDPRYVGGRIGMLAVLHTWTRTLEYHPHVHGLVPGGGVSAEGTWMPARPNFLVPVRALSRLFRGIFLAQARRALPDPAWSGGVRTQEWVVYAKPTVQRPEAVLAYLGRYVHRVAIANSRILSIDNGEVRFRYQRVGQSSSRIMHLAAGEFIRRFLQHVLPDGFHKVRYYGLWAPSNRQHLQRLREELHGNNDPGFTDPSNDERSFTDKDPPDRHAGAVPAAAPPLRCPQCQEGTLVWVARIAPSARAPPRHESPPTASIAT
jgi:hypothetical protein